MKQQLPGITRIAYLKCSDLPNYATKISLCGGFVHISESNIVDVYVENNAVCEADTEFDNNSTVQKTKLTFTSSDAIPSGHRLAFFLETANGQTYVIGTKERPFPIVQVSASTGLPSDERASSVYTITHTARKTLLPCKVVGI